MNSHKYSCFSSLILSGRGGIFPYMVYFSKYFDFFSANRRHLTFTIFFFYKYLWKISLGQKAWKFHQYSLDLIVCSSIYRYPISQVYRLFHIFYPQITTCVQGRYMYLKLFLLSLIFDSNSTWTIATTRCLNSRSYLGF